LLEEKEKWTCAQCGGIISLHDSACSECGRELESVT
jgi:rubrerythrin